MRHQARLTSMSHTDTQLCAHLHVADKHSPPSLVPVGREPCAVGEYSRVGDDRPQADVSISSEEGARHWVAHHTQQALQHRRHGLVGRGPTALQAGGRGSSQEEGVSALLPCRRLEPCCEPDTCSERRRAYSPPHATNGAMG